MMIMTTIMIMRMIFNNLHHSSCSQMKKCKTHGDCPGGAAPVGKKGGFFDRRGEDHREDDDGDEEGGGDGDVLYCRSLNECAFFCHFFWK